MCEDELKEGDLVKIITDKHFPFIRQRDLVVIDTINGGDIFGYLFNSITHRHRFSRKDFERTGINLKE